MAKKRTYPLITDFNDIPAEALVPKDEQPYEIPSHWRWVRTESVIQTLPAGDKKLPTDQYARTGKYPVIDQGSQYIAGYTNDASLVTHISQPIVIFGDHTRAAKYVDFDFVQGADGIRILEPTSAISAEYLHLWLNTEPVPSMGYRRHFSTLKKTPLPLPPIDEQQHISLRLMDVDRIVKTATEVITSSIASLNITREHLLSYALSGRATAHLGINKPNSLAADLPASALVPKDEQPYEIPAHWHWVRLGAVTDVVSGGTPRSSNPDFYGGDIPWITPKDMALNPSMYISKGAKSLTRNGLIKSAAKLLPQGSVCLSSRAPIGYVAIAKQDLATNQGLKSFTPSNDIHAEYLYWYLYNNSRLLESLASGTTFLELSTSRAKQIPFPLAPIEEQQAIAEYITNTSGRITQIHDQITLIKKLFSDLSSHIAERSFRALPTTSPHSQTGAQNGLRTGMG